MANTANNERSVTLNAAKAIVKHAIACGRPIFLKGPPGIGKSDIVREIGAEQDRPVIDIRLGQYDPTDIKGLLVFNTNTGLPEWTVPSVFPQDPKSRAIIFLDKLNSAPPAVQGAAYQLILDRRVNNYTLPKDVVIIAAGNRDSDKGVTYKMPRPLANRFVHLTIRPDADAWLDWAVGNAVHPDVVGFIGAMKPKLFETNFTSGEDAFATPRSWSFVSDLLHGADQLDEVHLQDMIAGTIGSGLMTEFMSHRKYVGRMPDVKDVLDGKISKMPADAPKEVSAHYTMAVNLCYTLKDIWTETEKLKKAEDMKKWHSMIDNFLAFIMNSFSKEMIVLAATLAVSKYKLLVTPKELKNFDKFHAMVGKSVMNAVKGAN